MKEYDIREAFTKLTENFRGTTKKEVRELCGENWNEDCWRSMVQKSNYAKDKVSNELPTYDKEKKLWFWI
jgi:hypothetical protein